MIDKTLNSKFGLVTRASKGTELTHSELDRNFENMLHATLLQHNFYDAEIIEMLNPRTLPAITESFVANTKYIAWSIPQNTVVGKVISIFEDVAGVKTPISSYTVWNDIDYHNGYDYTYTSVPTNNPPQVLSKDLFIMTASHTIGNTVTIEIADFIPPSPTGTTTGTTTPVI